MGRSLGPGLPVFLLKTLLSISPLLPQRSRNMAESVRVRGAGLRVPRGILDDNLPRGCAT